MSSNDEIKTKDIKSLPNSIDGNGSTFIDKLKKVLINFGYSIADNASTAANVSQVTELTLTETKTNSAKNIYVQFNKDGVKKFKEARIWVRTSAVATFTLDGVTTTGEYTKGGVSDSTTYYVKVVAVDTNDNVAEFSTAPVASITISAGSSSNPNPPTNLVVTWQGDVPTWSWRASSTPGNSSCFYELRTDNNPGSATNRFATVWWQSGTDIYISNGVPTTNVGTVYCYFRNEYGLYSVPLKKDFAFPSAVRPNPPRFEQVDGGFLILIDDFPPTYSTASIEVIYNDGTTETYQSNTTTKQIFGVSGRYKVRYKFNGATSEYDTEWSEYQEFELDRNPDIQEIDGSKISNGTVSGTKITDSAISADKIASNAVTSDKILANAVTAGKIDTNAITSDKINAGAITTAKLDTNAVTAEKIAVNTITSTQINSESIWSAVVAAGAVSATKITADQLSATTISLANNQGLNGGAVTLDANGLNCALTNGSKVQFNQNGMSFVDSNNNVFSSLARFKAGTVGNGEYVTLNWDVVPHTVLLFPHTVQTMVQGYASTNLCIKCYADTVTANGFTARVYTAVDRGTTAVMTYNGISGYNIYASNGTMQTGYSDFITSTNPAGGPINATFSFTVAFNIQQGTFSYSRYHQGHVYLETYTDNTLQSTTSLMSFSSRYSSPTSPKTLNVNKVVSLSANQTVKFRFKLDHKDEGVSTSWAMYGFEASGGTITADITSETILATGTAHYLALG